MAVGLLISTNVWANLPERPTPMVEPQGFQMNPDVNSGVQKAPMRKLVQNAEEQQVRLTYGSFDQTFTGENALHDAFLALPENSTPAKVTLLTDQAIQTIGTFFKVAKSISLELSGTTKFSKSS